MAQRGQKTVEIDRDRLPRRMRPLHAPIRLSLLLLLCCLHGILPTSTSGQPAPSKRRQTRDLPGPTRNVVELLPPIFESHPPEFRTNRSPLRKATRSPAPVTRDRRVVQASHTPAPQPTLPVAAETRPTTSVPTPAAPEPTVAATFCEECTPECRSWQILPSGLMYKSYLAGEKEPRMAAVWLYEQGRGWVWETTLGGRIGLFRYGTRGAVNPQGWQVDIEGAAFPRIDPEESSEMDAVDFRAGFVSTWRTGPLAVKAGYYHISSHIGDEYLLRNPTFPRIEYVRDSAILGMTYDINPALKTYGEVGYAVGHTGGAEPLELQFGLEYSPRACCSWRGAPFAAINGHLREDFDFGGNLNIVAGRQWRGPESDHLFRAGFMYFNGKSLQYQFFNKHEELLGAGIWFDF